MKMLSFQEVVWPLSSQMRGHGPFFLMLSLGPAALPPSLGFQLPNEHQEESEALSLVPKAPFCPPVLPSCPSGHSPGTLSFTRHGPPSRYPGTERQTVPKSYFSWQKQQLASNEATCFIFR